MAKSYFVAFDLGATSGRTILGTIEDKMLTIQELNRFPNQLLELHGRYYWNIFSIYEYLKEGLQLCVSMGIKPASIGIDAWGSDFVAIAEDGTFLGLPRAYRDPCTENKPEEFFQNVFSHRKVYDITGIQIMNFNTLYQLYALKAMKSSILKAANKLLFIPDALNYMLSGKMVTEYTIASTSQLLNHKTKKIEKRFLKSMGLNATIFPEIVEPGTIIGEISDSLSNEIGIGKIPVVAVAEHDTASAVLAVPAEDKQFAYLSSGTWSLMGVEVKDAIVNEESFKLNYTNEGGVEGTTRFLKNITGMWLLECCIREWKNQGREYSYSEIIAMMDVRSFRFFVDPDDPSFSSPVSMTVAIQAYCEKHGFETPQSDGEFIRCIFESLAMKYRYVFDRLRKLVPHNINRLHIIGGGAQNDLLNQFTANVVGIEVVAGPSEATAYGNILLQAIAMEQVKSVKDARELLLHSISVKKYFPKDEEAWELAYGRFQSICMFF